MEVRTLCYRCKSTYESVGYTVYKIKDQKYKSECELCKRAGFDYRIEKKIKTESASRRKR